VILHVDYYTRPVDNSKRWPLGMRWLHTLYNIRAFDNITRGFSIMRNMRLNSMNINAAAAMQKIKHPVYTIQVDADTSRFGTCDSFHSDGHCTCDVLCFITTAYIRLVLKLYFICS